MIQGIGNQLQTLDDFVGTDFWVRARVRNSNSSYSYEFIQVVSSDKETTEHGFTYKTYNIREIDIRQLSRGDVYYCTQYDKDRKLNSKGIKYPGYNIRLLEPLEIASTDEMFRVVEENN